MRATWVVVLVLVSATDARADHEGYGQYTAIADLGALATFGVSPYLGPRGFRAVAGVSGVMWFSAAPIIHLTLGENSSAAWSLGMRAGATGLTYASYRLACDGNNYGPLAGLCLIPALAVGGVAFVAVGLVDALVLARHSHADAEPLQLRVHWTF